MRQAHCMVQCILHEICCVTVPVYHLVVIVVHCHCVRQGQRRGISSPGWWCRGGGQWQQGLGDSSRVLCHHGLWGCCTISFLHEMWEYMVPYSTWLFAHITFYLPKIPHILWQLMRPLLQCRIKACNCVDSRWSTSHFAAQATSVASQTAHCALLLMWG